MALTIEKATAGTPFALQDADLDRWFEVVIGDLHALPRGRGENIIVPGAPGLSPVPFVDQEMPVHLHGYIAGIGSTHAARKASYRAQRTALNAQIVASGTLVTVTATEPTMGLTDGETATITAQFQRIVEPRPSIEDEMVEMTIELLCMSDPVAWDIDEGSS